MKNFRFIAASLFLIVFMINEISAIPAFGRKYKLSCQTCHSPIPRLKAFGDEFAGNGFKMPEMESRRYYIDTGDEELSLIRDFPLAVRLDIHAVAKTGDYENGFDLQSPYLLKLLSGGELADDLAYYFYFYMDERGEIAGVEDAYIMFNNLFDLDLDLYLGQFQISDPLFKRELRLTLEDYQIYKQKVGEANANLAYDRGLMLTLGLDTGTDVIFEVVNGNGLSEADDLKNFDRDGLKNYFARISQNVTDFLRVGAFGFLGKEELENNTGGIFFDKITMFGPDLTIGNDFLELNMQYVWRKDGEVINDNISHIDAETKGAIAELVYTPKGDESKWYMVGLFNWIDSDIEALKYQTATFHTGYMFRRNMRMVAEYKYDFEKEYNTISVGIVSAF
jgi:hypothetical protein